MITCNLTELYFFKKDEFITDVLKEAFLKTWKSQPPIYLVKLPNCSSSYSIKQPGTAATVLSLLLSSVN